MEKYFGFAQELLERGKAVEAPPYGADSLYDLLNQFDDDIPFYLGLAQAAQGKVLEVGCGSGRVLHRLAEAGIDVVGLDASAEMLRQAAARLGERKAELVHGDMRSFELPHMFQLIIIPYCTLIYATNDQERRAVFERCFQHLHPGGVLAFDFLAGKVSVGEELPYLALQGVHPFTGEVLVHTVQVKGIREDLRLLNQVSYHMGEDGPAKITVQASLEGICPSERVAELLTEVGFSVRGIYSDYSGTPYAGEEFCVIVAEK
ncbi:MAG TPA: class I SAM-dependent methyltransferase [Firmicutes bacterium]|jgi:SAM-dependent methyltransferase|nr:class I SAM-dependent methyltransferase [Bacillota bacterium]